MPIVKSDFKPAWWLANPHLQTIWAPLFRYRPAVALQPERVELDDGDFIDLTWHRQQDKLPVVLILHGLEGCIESHYAKPLIKQLGIAGYTACFMHLRGCSGEPNRLNATYHSGKSDDLQRIVSHIESAHQRPVYAAIGFSLGGNVLLKWLGEQGEAAAVERAMAVSAPFLLRHGTERMVSGLSLYYQRRLVEQMKDSHRKRFVNRSCPWEIDLDAIQTFYDFDQQITAPFNGFESASQYYDSSSCRQFIPRIKRPTLILHASDDPFMFPHSVPEAGEIPDCVTLELAERGGHVGFIGGKWLPGITDYYTEKRAVNWLAKA